MNILIIEDSATIANIYKTVIANEIDKRNGTPSAIRIVNSVQQWIDIKRTFKPNIIISDWVLVNNETAEPILLDAINTLNVSPSNIAIISGFIYKDEDGSTHPSDMNTISLDYGIDCFTKPVTSKQIASILFGRKLMGEH